jgi:hypothetical protein
VRHDQRSTIAREVALERLRGRHISTLRMIDDEELRAGTARAEAELPPAVVTELRWLLAFGEAT